jgi:hypothetical protein
MRPFAIRRTRYEDVTGDSFGIATSQATKTRETPELGLP